MDESNAITNTTQGAICLSHFAFPLSFRLPASAVCRTFKQYGSKQQA